MPIRSRLDCAPLRGADPAARASRAPPRHRRRPGHRKRLPQARGREIAHPVEELVAVGHHHDVGVEERVDLRRLVLDRAQESEMEEHDENRDRSRRRSRRPASRGLRARGSARRTRCRIAAFTAADAVLLLRAACASIDFDVDLHADEAVGGRGFVEAHPHLREAVDRVDDAADALDRAFERLPERALETFTRWPGGEPRQIAFEEIGDDVHAARCRRA